MAKFDASSLTAKTSYNPADARGGPRLFLSIPIIYCPRIKPRDHFLRILLIELSDPSWIQLRKEQPPHLQDDEAVTALQLRLGDVLRLDTTHRRQKRPHNWQKKLRGPGA